MFTNALYYPTIDIRNDRWLKSAALFWNSIETIVPEAKKKNPYENRTAKEFYESGILRPHVVNPNCDDVVGVEYDVMKFAKTKEGKKLMFRRSTKESSFNNCKNMIGMQETEMEDRLIDEFAGFNIHVEKLPIFLQEELKQYRDKDGFVLTTAEFRDFYMTILSNSICRRNGLSLLTDRVMFNDLSNKILKEKIDLELEPSCLNSPLQTVLYGILLDNLIIDPDTPVKKIVAFKGKYHDELARFRMEISRLTDIENIGDSFTAISEHALSIYDNGIVPSINDLKKALDGATIKWATNNMYNYVISGIAPAALNMVDLTSVQNISISAGLVLGFTLLGGWQSRKDIMRNSPYTYLMKANQKFKMGKNR